MLQERVCSVITHGPTAAGGSGCVLPKSANHPRRDERSQLCFQEGFDQNTESWELPLPPEPVAGSISNLSGLSPLGLAKHQSL